MNVYNPAIAAAALVLAVAAPAQAQAPRLNDFVLAPLGATNLPARVDVLGKQLPRSDVDTLLSKANRPATPNGECSKTAFTDMPAGSRWYCFDPADSGAVGEASGFRRASARAPTPARVGARPCS